MDELTVKVHESEEGLNVLNFPRFWPIRNGLNFLCGHGESVRRETETEVLGGGGMELTLLWLGEEIVLSEVSEDFMDVFLMGLEVLGVYQDVIQIDDYTDVEEVHNSVWSASGRPVDHPKANTGGAIDHDHGGGGSHVLNL